MLFRSIRKAAPALGCSGRRLSWMSLLFWGIGLSLIPGATTTAAFAFQDPGQPQVPEKTETPVEQEKQPAPENTPPEAAESAPQTQDPAKAPTTNAAGSATGNSQESIGPMVQAYLNKRKEFRDLDGQINQLLTSVSPTAASDYQAMVEQLKKLRERKAELGNEILDASVDAYLESPDRFREVNDDLTKLMRSLLGEQGTSSRFDPQKARDVAERLINARAKNLNVHFYGSYAAYCLNEFDLARKWLDRLLEAGAKPEQTILKQIEDASSKWGRELALREADAQSQVPQVAVQTDLGEFVVELYENEAPNTVANFIMLVEKKYYDGSFIYLSQPGRLVMAGCTKGDGRTNAGYFIPDEVDRPEIRHHFSGVLAMAAEEPNTGSARFSILQQPTPGGDGKLTVFGRIISGMDVIYRVPAIKPTDIKLGAKPVKIESMRVVRKRDHAYEPKTIPLSEGEKSGK